MNLHFVSYASNAYENYIGRNKYFVNKYVKPRSATYYTFRDLQADKIYQTNRHIFDASPAGYYAWKPWAILKRFKEIPDDDVLIYHDCGMGFRYVNLLKPSALLRIVEKNGNMPGVTVPHFGPNRYWTTKQCFEHMKCDTIEYLNAPQVEASISLWKKNTDNLLFLTDWLQHCLMDDCILPPHELNFCKQSPDFVSHRFDQSILTNLTYKYDFTPLTSKFDSGLTKSLTLIELEQRLQNIQSSRLYVLFIYFAKIASRIRNINVKKYK